MSDSLALHDVECRTRIGVSDAERATVQTLLVSVWLRLDLKPVAAADDPSNGVNYDDVIDVIRRASMVERKTIERFAEDIAGDLLVRFGPAGAKLVTEVTVHVEKKPYPDARCVAISITRN